LAFTAVFTIVTFPFLFGIMFGDVGHGFMLLAAVIYLIWNEKKLAAAKLNEVRYPTNLSFPSRSAMCILR